jgi:tripartite-type tricarboxylate transporter receptor subunit TctC
MYALLSRRPVLLGTVALAAPALNVALAQSLRRTLRLVVPFPPGGSVDTLGRLMADRLAAALDQTVVVENRGGAAGLIGADAVAKGPPDGSVIGIVPVTVLCAAPFLQQAMPFDPIRDLRAVSQVTDTGIILAVGADRARERGWTDLAAALAWARANPGRMRIAHSGSGSVTHLTLAAVVAAARVEITQVPYRGGTQGTTDVLAGTIDGIADAPAGLMPHLETGRVRALGISSGRRLALLPGVPAMAETPGLEGVDVRSWNAVMAPRGTPDAELARLHRGVRAVGDDPTFATALRALGWDVATSDNPEALAARIADETPRWRRLVEVSGARSD